MHGGRPAAGGIATIVVKDGQPVGGVQDLSFTEGDDIRFKVDSDVADEVHFHGYDVGMDVEAGRLGHLRRPGDDHRVSSRSSSRSACTQLAEITVNPS